MDNRYAHEFPINDQCVYLNHAAVAPWPKRACDAVAKFALENTQIGASDYPHWIRVEDQLRSNLAQLLNASIDEIALVKNTSEALSFVAYGVDWQAGDLVLISDEEFPSNRIVWESLADKGVIVKEVSLKGAQPEAQLLEAISQGVRLVSISAIQYGNGTCLNLEAIGQACKETNTLFCVDAIQAVGAVEFDVKRCHCDFAMADGHKWLLGPEGLGFFYVRSDKLKSLSLSEYGWHMVEKAGDYATKDWSPANSAVRFECGSPNMLAAHALVESTSLLLEIGMAKVETLVKEKATYLAEQLSLAGAKILTPEHSLGASGIVSFKFDAVDSNQLYRNLMERKVICAARGGGVRFAPHFHTTKEVMDQSVKILKELVC